MAFTKRYCAGVVGGLTACILMFSSHVAAQTHVVKSKCKNVTYKPDESVEYKPNISAKGWALKPVDAHAPAIDIGEPTINLNIPSDRYIDTTIETTGEDGEPVVSDAYNYDFSESHINVGKLTLKKNKLFFNDQEIKQTHPDCEE